MVVAGRAGAAPPGLDAPAADPVLVLETFEDREFGTEVRIGRFRVFEDRDARAGRTIDLDVVVLPAVGAPVAPDPVFLVSGGPGLNAAVGWRRHVDSWMREHRDLVLVSQRGTGGSMRLACDTGVDDPQRALGPLFTVDTFRACLAELEPVADLTKYSTPMAMDDLDDLRVALGYEKINLHGGSYGTRACLVYMRRHPDTVRAAILTGVAPMSFVNPLYHARGGQQAIDLILAECAADPDCARAYPDLAARFQVVLNRLATAPATAEVRHPTTGAPVTVTLDRRAFADALRMAMYIDSRDVPRILNRAFLGDFDEFAQRALDRNHQLLTSLSLGMLLCVTCAEDVDRIDEAAIVRETAGTFTGDGRVRDQIAVCAFWPRSELPEGFADPVRVDVPVLLLSGALDPVTPPEWGEEAARHLPNSRHVVAPGAHGVGGPCIRAIERVFLECGTVEGLDTACVERMRLGPFTVPAIAPEPVGPPMPPATPGVYHRAR